MDNPKSVLSKVGQRFQTDDFNPSKLEATHPHPVFPLQKFGFNPDGVALFYKTTRFDMHGEAGPHVVAFSLVLVANRDFADFAPCVQSLGHPMIAS